jgi:hypothetical protein
MINTTEKIQEAKKVLKEAGYFTHNLWHILDVKGKFEEVTDEQAQIILKHALTNEATMEHIWETIKIVAMEENLTPKD